MSPRFYGSLQVSQRIGQVAYQLQFPDNNKIDLVFYVSLLKKTIPPQTSSKSLPPMFSEDLELQVQSAQVLDICNNPYGFKVLTQ